MRLKVDSPAGVGAAWQQGRATGAAQATLRLWRLVMCRVLYIQSSTSALEPPAPGPKWGRASLTSTCADLT